MSEATVIKPLHKALVIKDLPRKDRTDTGIFLPPSTTLPLSKAIVIGVGDNSSDLIKKGGEVIYRTGSGSEVTSNGEDYLLIAEINCVAVIVDNVAIPLHTGIIIKELPKDEKTATGVIIPLSVNTKLSNAKVISFGEKCQNGIIKKGDTIRFITGSGTEIISNDETFLLIDEGNCVAVV
jgi:chaperonin GroES